MRKKLWKDVREIPASGIPNWGGGAYTLAFVYSTEGNFLCKGYFKEVEEYLKGLADSGLKFFVNYSLRHTDLTPYKS